MSKNHKTFFIALLGLVLFLVTFVLWQERIVLFGSEIVLATRPIDPRDLFRGEYVVLRYEIEQNEMVTKTTNGLGDGKSVYLKLVPNAEGIAQVAEVSVSKPDFSSGAWLRGEVTGGGVRFSELEQYYVPEGSGKPIERMRTGLHTKVSILGGEARVIGLLDKDLKPINPGDYLDE